MRFTKEMVLAVVRENIEHGRRVRLYPESDIESRKIQMVLFTGGFLAGEAAPEDAWCDYRCIVVTPYDGVLFSNIGIAGYAGAVASNTPRADAFSWDEMNGIEPSSDSTEVAYVSSGIGTVSTPWNEEFARRSALSTTDVVFEWTLRKTARNRNTNDDGSL